MALNELIFEYVRGYDCATARNSIAQKAVNDDVDYVLMVDNDVIIPQDAIKNFCEDPKLVTLGSYAHRDKDNIYRGRTCICKLYDESGKKYFNYPNLILNNWVLKRVPLFIELLL